MEFRRAYDSLVLPIFYGVNPSEVRDQESSFGEAFRELIQKISPTVDELTRWMIALSEAGGICGLVVPNFDSNIQSEHIQNIINSVRHMLDTKVQFATQGLGGVSSPVQEVMTMLQKHQSKDVVSIGIWGMAGIGKTTLARIIFDRIHNEFQSTCFLSNVREDCERNGLVKSQRKLLLEICGATDMRINSINLVSLGSKKRPYHKKVLVVLDDVNHLEQLRALCRTRELFGKGSRIIITTRDFHVLKAFPVNDVYSMKLLINHESLQLFSREAFKQASPEGEFIQLSRRAVAYAEGLPLALQVLGSLLYGKSPQQWDSALMKLSTVLPPGLYDTLKLSFDSLDSEEKEIFTNIALFYVGEEKNDVINKLDARGCNASIGIRALVDRSLLTIDSNNKLRMHHLLQIMGRQIIRQSSQNELPNQGHRYEVFLSFRGEDTRATFTSHLYSALCNAGLIVFKDDVELPRGNYIKTELLQAIGSSRIAIIIFSKGYAASKWCLEELSIIMELRKSNDRLVLPVFYDVDPSEIRNQTSRFGEKFEELIQAISPPESQVSNWRTALADAGGIAGIVVLGSSDESEKVTAVVESVCNILDKKDLFVAEHPVGVDNRLQEAISMLQNHQSKDVVMVGLWGMGGTGKTTIAKAIYNEIGRTFESRCYISNVREVWGQEKGQVSLQNQLLSKAC